jgi:uncharacterized membrane protein
MTETIASWHPFIVHFAVALTITSAAFDVLDFFLQKPSFERSGFHLMIAAIPFLLMAVLSGNLAEGFVRDIAPPHVLDTHITYANIAIWVFSAAALWRIFLVLKRQYTGKKKIAYVFIVTAAAMSVFLAAQNGGKIVHRPFDVTKTLLRQEGAVQ